MARRTIERSRQTSSEPRRVYRALRAELRRKEENTIQEQCEPVSPLDWRECSCRDALKNLDRKIRNIQKPKENHKTQHVFDGEVRMKRNRIFFCFDFNAGGVVRA